jgi:hypothetical protein
MRSSPWLVIGAALLGCGADSNADAPLERTTKFSDLGEHQADDLCDQVHALRDDAYLNGLCTMMGVTLAPLEGGTCAEQRAKCLKDPPPMCFPAMTRSARELDCPETTVGMFLDCMAGTVRATKELYAPITCDTPVAQATRLALDAFDMNLDTPPAECAEFKRTCPGFFEHDATDPARVAPLRLLQGLRTPL